MSPMDPRRALLAVAARADGDVAEGALWIAAEERTDVDVARTLDRLDRCAAEVRGLLGGAPSSTEGALRALGTVVHERLGLRAGAADDPRCHHLDCVVSRGLGVPITCSVVWIAVGRRAGIAVEGVGLPGHFVVRIDGLLVDAHAGGVPLDEAAALRLVAAALGAGPPSLTPAWLRAASSREILTRISRNLRVGHAAGGRWGQALRAADRCVALQPGDPVELRERGLLRFRVGLILPASRDLGAYLAAAPDAADREAVEKVRIRALGMLN